MAFVKLSGEKQKKPIGFALLIAGLIFLCNPSVQLLDFLPDTVGYLLILLALRSVRDKIPAFETAAKSLSVMLFISVCRLPALLVLMGIRSSNTGDRSATALFLFGFLILELVFGIPAFRDLFSAFFHLSERYGVDSAGYVVQRGKKTDAASLLKLTYVFLAVRETVSLLPECLYLVTKDSLDSDGALYPLEPLYPTVFAACMVLGAAVGIAWLATAIPYFRRVSRDPLMAAIDDEIRKTLPDVYTKKVAVFRKDKTALTLFTVGVLFLTDFAVDARDILPDFIAGVLFAVSMFMLAKNGLRIMRISGFASVLFTTVSIFDYAVITKFRTTYDASALGRVKAADKLYSVCEISGSVKAILTVGLIVLLAVSFMCYLTKLLKDRREDGILLYSDKAVLAENRGGCVRICVFVSLEALLSAADIFIRRVTETVAADEDMLGTSVLVFEKYGWFWLVPFFMGLVAFGFAFFDMGDMTERVKSAYELDE